jgi:ribosomal protein S18 acetylase RimI-like enzyme
MRIRPAQPADLDGLIDIDGTIESPQYLHVERSGEGLLQKWVIEERQAREKLIDANAIDDDRRFALKQILGGVEEGTVLVAEHEDQLVALAVARPEVDTNALRLLDLRVDYEFRRQGLGSVLLYQLITQAREDQLRAVVARTLTNNLPAARFLSKAGFDLGGLDTHFLSNHDLVKEAVSLFWYAALD